MIYLCHYSINKMLDGMLFFQDQGHVGTKTETIPITKCCFSAAP